MSVPGKCNYPCPLCGGCACNIAEELTANPIGVGEECVQVCWTCHKPMIFQRREAGYVGKEIREEDMALLPASYLQKIAQLEEARRQRQ